MARKTKKNKGRPTRAAKTGGSKSKKPAKAQKRAVPRAQPVARGGRKVHFTCSECYEEFILRAAQMRETLTCPECLHVGKRPEENFLAKVNQTRGREKRILGLAVLLSIVTLVAGAGAVLASGPHGGMITGVVGGTADMILGGGLGLGALVALALTIQYERNRWEVYF